MNKTENSFRNITQSENGKTSRESIDVAKRRIRQAAQAARRALGAEARAEKSRAIAEKLFNELAWKRAKTVCVYVWFQNEVQTDAILDRAWQDGKTVAVPLCCDDLPEKIRLYRLENRSQLTPGAYGIPEPSEEWRRQENVRIDESQVDLYLVPGVAFDRQNNRLGWGGGYYDRLLARAPSADKIALAFDCQIVDSVPVGKFDLPLDKIIRE